MKEYLQGLGFRLVASHLANQELNAKKKVQWLAVHFNIPINDTPESRQLVYGYFILPEHILDLSLEDIVKLRNIYKKDTERQWNFLIATVVNRSQLLSNQQKCALLLSEYERGNTSVIKYISRSFYAKLTDAAFAPFAPLYFVNYCQRYDEIISARNKSPVVIEAIPTQPDLTPPGSITPESSPRLAAKPKKPDSWFKSFKSKAPFPATGATIGMGVGVIAGFIVGGPIGAVILGTLCGFLGGFIGFAAMKIMASSNKNVYISTKKTTPEIAHEEITEAFTPPSSSPVPVPVMTTIKPSIFYKAELLFGDKIINLNAGDAAGTITTMGGSELTL